MMDVNFCKKILKINNNQHILYIEFLENETLHFYFDNKNKVDLINLYERKKRNVNLDIIQDDRMIKFNYLNYQFIINDNLEIFIDKVMGIKFFNDSKYQTLLNVSEDVKVFGLGDKMSALNKVGYEYESWATDDSKHHDESFKSLYKVANYLLINNQNSYFGFFFPSTYKYHFDICKCDANQIVVSNKKATQDFYLFLGNDVKKITSNYSKLVGHPYLIRLKMLGNNQSRFTYKSENEVMDVVNKYYENNLPLDYIHLDIEYMDGFRDFTVDKNNFPSLKKLTMDMIKKGVELVAINDAGIKKDLDDKLYSYLSKNNLFGTLNGEIYHNIVWPGESAFPNYFDSKCKRYANRIAKEFIFENNISGIWNDMNEPASFNGELPLEVDFSLKNRKLTNEEGHNVYAEHMVKALLGIYEEKNIRPYLFTRAAFPTTSKYAFVWNGDNASIWNHLKLSIPQILSIGLSNFMINGVDIGGFNEDVNKELLCRWIESSVLTPFMRNHSSINTRKQEPYSFDQETMDIYRKYLKIRYRFLPYLYNLVYRMNKYGELINAPLFYYYQNDKECLSINDQYMVGDSIIVSPILEKDSNKKIVYLPKGDWVDYFSNKIYKGNRHYIIEMNLSECGIFIKNNTIIPMFEDMNNISKKNIKTLILKIYGKKGNLELYDDDGETLDYQKGIYNLYQISYKNNELSFSTVYGQYESTFKTIKIIKDDKEIVIPFNNNFKIII